jgi:hypothetical protein
MSSSCELVRRARVQVWHRHSHRTASTTRACALETASKPSVTCKEVLYGRERHARPRPGSR